MKDFEYLFEIDVVAEIVSKVVLGALLVVSEGLHRD